MKSTEIALASQTAAKPQTKIQADDGLSDYLYKQLRGYGHVVQARMNDPLSHSAQLPPDVLAKFNKQRMAWKMIAIAVPVAGLLALAGAKNGVEAWQQRSARIAAEARAEVARKDQESKAAAAAAEAKVYADAFANADKTLMGFIAGAEALPVEKTFANAEDILGANQVAAADSIKAAVTSIIDGKPVAHASVVTGAGAWTTAIVAKPLAPDAGYLVGVAVNEAGVRKALVFYGIRMKNGGETGLYAIRTASPEIEAKVLYLDQAVKPASFEQLKERIVRGFMPTPAATSASTNN